VRDTSRPAAPAITVTDQSATQITVSVKDSSTNEEGFKIYVKGPSDAAPILAITKPAQKPIPNVGTDYSFSFTLPAQEFQKYEFVATSFLTVNQQTLESDKTDPKANATAYAIKPPQPVYGVAIDSVTADSIHLVWSDGEPDVTQYTVTVSSPPDPSVDKVAYRLDYLATGLTTASKTYCFQVRAWKGPQSSPPSALVCNPPLPNPK
jgi:hypothetical protein